MGSATNPKWKQAGLAAGLVAHFYDESGSILGGGIGF